MNISDFLIIYLTLGSPLAAHYFFQNRKELNQSILIFNTMFVLTVWIPYAIKIMAKYLTNLFEWRRFSLTAGKRIDRESLNKFEQVFTDHLLAAQSPIGIYEFREIFERYVGLTTAFRQVEFSSTPTKAELEFHKAAGLALSETSARCLHRRNLILLAKHRQAAADDLLDCLINLLPSQQNDSIFTEKVQNFLEFIDDRETLGRFRQMIKLQETVFSPDALPVKRMAAANR